jgi:hypothetical protein
MGGVKKKVWLVSDYDGFTYTVTNGYVTALSFATYEGLISMESYKKSHSFGYEAAVNAAGLVSNYTHNLSVKVISETPNELGAIEDLAGWEGPAVVEDNNGLFWLVGADSGLVQATGTKTSGQNPADDMSDIVTFTAEMETKLPQRIFVTDAATTLALIEGYEI